MAKASWRRVGSRWPFLYGSGETSWRPGSVAAMGCVKLCEWSWGTGGCEREGCAENGQGGARVEGAMEACEGWCCIGTRGEEMACEQVWGIKGMAGASGVA